MRSSMKRLASYLLIGVVVLSGTQLWAGNRARTVVVPALYPMVQLGADVSILTGATLLTYEPVAVANGEFPLVHRWIPRSKSWERVTAEVYSFGHYMQVQSIDEIIVVGSDAMVPARLLELAPSPNIRRITSIQPSTVANALHQTMDFSRSQWRTLAKRHRFEIEDRNAEERRYGRYGRYGASAAVPEPAPSAPEASAPAGEVEVPAVETVEVLTVTSAPVAIVEVSEVAPQLKGMPAPVVEAAQPEVEVVTEEEIVPEVEVATEVAIVPEVAVPEVPMEKDAAVDAIPALTPALPQEKGADPLPQLSPIEAAQAPVAPVPPVEVKQ